jgi:hypothetical protein
LSTNEAGNVTVEQLAAQYSGETLADGARPRCAREGVLMISMASASNTRANRQAAGFVSRSYVSRTPLTAHFPPG